MRNSQLQSQPTGAHPGRSGIHTDSGDSSTAFTSKVHTTKGEFDGFVPHVNSIGRCFVYIEYGGCESSVRDPARWASAATTHHAIEGAPTGSMKSVLSIFSFLFIALGAVMLFERPAYAYADPGSGLLAIQAAGSALVATGWYLRRKIYLLLHRDSSKRSQENLPASPNVEDSPNP